LYYHLHISTSKELATLRALVKVRRVVSPDLKKGQMVTLVSASTRRGVKMTFFVQNICLFPARRPFPAMKWPKLAFCEQEMSIVHGFVGKRGASWQEMGNILDQECHPAISPSWCRYQGHHLTIFEWIFRAGLTTFSYFDKSSQSSQPLSY